MPDKPLSSFLGVTAALCMVALSAGCGLKLEMETTPEPVALGNPLTYDIKATNVTSCPVKPTQFTLIPLLSEEQVAALNEILAESTLPLPPLEFICAFGGLVEDLDEKALEGMTREDFLRNLPPTALQGSTFTVETLTGPIVCQEMESDGIFALECETGPLASGETVEKQIILIPTEAGVFLNVAFGQGVSGGVCDGGDNAGEACSISSEDCPGGNCDSGVCKGGSNDMLGCEDAADCPDGSCVDCDQCTVPGVCREGENQGEECSSDADCDPNPDDGSCSCGIALACTTTTVEESTPTPTATSTPTATPTNTPVPEGGPCTTTLQCDTGLVCLNRICQSTAPAPTTSRTALLVGLGMLVAIAALALWRRRELKDDLWPA